MKCVNRVNIGSILTLWLNTFTNMHVKCCPFLSRLSRHDRRFGALIPTTIVTTSDLDKNRHMLVEFFIFWSWGYVWVTPWRASNHTFLTVQCVCVLKRWAMVTWSVLHLPSLLMKHWLRADQMCTLQCLRVKWESDWVRDE